MGKLVSSVFKIIIGFMLLMIFGSMTLGVIDAFTTIDRIQSVATFMQTDLASNNCITHSGYSAYVDELKSISDKSSVIKATGTFDGSTASPINAYLVNSDGSLKTTSDYVQQNEGGNFAVANQGNILELRINTKVNLRVFLFGNSSGEINKDDTSIGTFGWWGTGRQDLIFKYRVPALRYLK